MNKKKTLPALLVNTDIIDKLLAEFRDYIETVEDIEPYYNGYNNKSNIIVEKKPGELKPEYIICQGYQLNYINESYNLIGWKQYVLRRSEEVKEIEQDATGSYAFTYIKNEILKYYTPEEFDACLLAHVAEYDDNKKQYHFTPYGDPSAVYKYDECYKYDINGAHNAALIEIFPRAEGFLTKLYDERHEKPINKKYINYFCGMLCRKGYRTTYNWIVQRTTKILMDAIKQTEGILIYANTDGFAVYKPKYLIKPGKDIGKFKLEYYGDIYTYNADNYSIIQCGDKIVGNVLYKARPEIDLRIGKVIDYKRTPIFDKNGELLAYDAGQMEAKYVKIR